MKNELYRPVTFHPPSEQPKSDSEPNYINLGFCQLEVDPNYTVLKDPSILPPPPSLPMPVFNPPLPIVAPAQLPSSIATPKPVHILSPNQQPKIKAYDTAQAFIQSVPVLIVGEALYFFDGRIYRLATLSEMRRLIIRICRPHIQVNGTTQLVRQVYEFVRDEPTLVRDDLRENQNFLAFDNGVLDLRNGTLMPFDPQVFVTAKVRGNYIPEAANQRPHFIRFLEDISSGDQLLVQRIWQMLGYCLVPDQTGKTFFVAQGVTNSGKSVLGEVLSSFFDPEAVTALSISDFGRQFGPSELLGKRLSLCMDLSATPWDARAVGQLKALTGNDLITADVKYCPPIQFRNTAKFVFGTNHPVTLSVRDEAFLSRLVTIPFQFSVSKDRQDRTLKGKLMGERDAIISTAVASYFDLRRTGYRFSGDYRLNAVIAQGRSTAIHSWDEAIPEFFFQCCNLDEGRVTFLDNLYRRFTAVYPELSDVNVFSLKLLSLIEREFPGRVKKCRKRRHGQGNPISAFEGLCLLDAGGEDNE